MAMSSSSASTNSSIWTGARGAGAARLSPTRWRAATPKSNSRALGQFPRLSGATDGQAVDAQRRLTDAHRHALAFLAARAHTIIKFQVVADHADACEHIRPVADECCPFQRRAEPAVFDPVRLARRKDEFSGGDINLAAAEVDRIDATRHGAQDLLRRVG